MHGGGMTGPPGQQVKQKSTWCHRHRRDMTGGAPSDPGFAHTGGADLVLPSRGVIDVVPPPASPPPAPPTPALPPPAAAVLGRRAATLSASQMSRSLGVHSSTAQIKSKSSSRIVV